MALRSAIEVVACIFLAQRREIITVDHFNLLYSKEEELVKMTSGLMNKLEQEIIINDCSNYGLFTMIDSL